MPNAPLTSEEFNRYGPGQQANASWIAYHSKFTAYLTAHGWTCHVGAAVHGDTPSRPEGYPLDLWEPPIALTTDAWIEGYVLRRTPAGLYLALVECYPYARTLAFIAAMEQRTVGRDDLHDRITAASGAEGLISNGAYERALEDWHEQRADAEANYHDRLNDGLSRELARIDLPLSTYTSWYWKMDLSNVFKTLSLRVDAHAQWETRQFANLLAGMVQRVAPLSYAAWREHALGTVTFSYTERQVLARYLRAGLTTAPVVTPEIEAMLGKRGATEFVAKLQPPVEPPSFDLDLTAAKDAQHYLDLYTPKPHPERRPVVNLQLCTCARGNQYGSSGHWHCNCSRINDRDLNWPDSTVCETCGARRNRPAPMDTLRVLCADLIGLAQNLQNDGLVVFVHDGPTPGFYQLGRHTATAITLATDRLPSATPTPPALDTPTRCTFATFSSAKTRNPASANLAHDGDRCSRRAVWQAVFVRDGRPTGDRCCEHHRHAFSDLGDLRWETLPGAPVTLGSTRP